MPNMAVNQHYSPSAKRGFLKSFPRLAPSFFMFLKQYFLRFPALLALTVQLFSCGLVLVLCWLVVNIFFYFSIEINNLKVFSLVVLQAIIACTMAYFLGMAIWWCWIHLVFPIVVWAMLMFDVPNEIYLAGFLVTLSIFWTSFRTQVPYYPSRLDVWQQMVRIAAQYQSGHTAPLRIIDIGSGLGGLSLYLAKNYPDAHIEGIEIAPLPWLMSRIRALITRSKARFKLGNYHALNFAAYDIVFAYLSPAAMTDLWEKSKKEMRTGTLLISLEFEVPDLAPTESNVQKGQGRSLYVYKIA